jgi:signal transduction protein with GAF and PtsI domain
MQEYFASKETRFQSFASLNVVGAGKVIAVVNVECADKYLFGEEEEDKAEMVAYLFPLCSTLGILLADQ